MSIEDIRRSAEQGQLVVVLGAGVTMSLATKASNALNWSGLIKSALLYGNSRSLLTDKQFARYSEALETEDLDELLGVAEFASRKLEAPDGHLYSSWMKSVFSNWAAGTGGMKNALLAIESYGIPITTLNFDTLAEEVTGLPTINYSDKDGMVQWASKEKNGVLHLHGVWSNPSSCVFSIRDYHSATNDAVRALLQRSLGSFNRLLFVGCGDTFQDPNFSGLIDWLRQHIGTSTPRHFALVREAEVPSRLANVKWRGFVEPLSFGENFADLPGFLLNCFPTKRSPAVIKNRENAVHNKHAKIIASYRDFLLRDCGEITVEGMRADLDMAQRKFDLERLFVPLEVVSAPPVIPLSDPMREQKLQEWSISSEAIPHEFATAFQKNRRIALLALPGGGKTLLLKRLAVAYASPTRRETSADNLPAIDLVPVMIRCREWKEHIRKPIGTLLDQISSITGEKSLDGLGDALERPLKSGNVLLLVDGLDEIHDDADRSIFVDNLEKYLEKYNKSRLIITSREAGFELVAPSLSRFCTKFKIAPLSHEAITLLCEHWHNLMGNGSPQALQEAAEVASKLIESDSLRRLSENPLLLTMLLVVKHSAGRLPPDRVTLYERAVEVLLDTWNIKGHEALNAKEAVPQLACVAFELLKQGKQTATEKDILAILEEAREKLPMLGRWAKDSPHDFLKRVELRSSLVLEGGHTNENGKTVPFYQFRHLTFQEYLAAKASVEGFTLDPLQRVSALAALEENIFAEEWKEVIPMAAVLLQMKAAPLLDRIIQKAEDETKKFLSSKDEFYLDIRMPPAAARLTQAMSEEAYFSSETLPSAINTIVSLANGCRTNDNWYGLAQGPYGEDLRRVALRKFLETPHSGYRLTRNTAALMEAYSEKAAYWLDDGCLTATLNYLDSDDEANLTRAILSIAGAFWLYRETAAFARSEQVYNSVQKYLGEQSLPLRTAALWAWSFWRLIQIERDRIFPEPSPMIIELLVADFFEVSSPAEDLTVFAISTLTNVGRSSVELEISEEKRSVIRGYLSGENKEKTFQNRITILVLLFIIRDVATDEEIIRFIRSQELLQEKRRFKAIASYLGLDRPKKRKRKVS